MKSGDLPGARKIDGKLQLPLPDLAEILEPTTCAPVVARTSASGSAPKPSRRRSRIGPRVAFIRAGQFWELVTRGLGLDDLAAELAAKWKSERDEMRREYAESVAERLAGELPEGAEREKRGPI
ncbi:hypothetical protein HF690_05245 [Oleiagrimonas citrea]|uniref:Uncharacterized protein n=2 Tax=Oleiagrimonas citrea TaxID=1665687 RepID=A0A846ZKP5_9GAMM|nr:hypothetical protein [Oleiagrimonas citrea]